MAVKFYQNEENLPNLYYFENSSDRKVTIFLKNIFP